MYIVREIFYLKFGQYRQARKLVEEAMAKNLLPQTDASRMLTDFTGPSYRLIFESGHASLADFEKSLSAELNETDWQGWYNRFKPLVEKSCREILKIM